MKHLLKNFGDSFMSNYKIGFIRFKGEINIVVFIFFLNLCHFDKNSTDTCTHCPIRTSVRKQLKEEIKVLN